MKTIITIIITLGVSLSFAQSVVYNENGKKQKIERTAERMELKIKEESPEIPATQIDTSHLEIDSTFGALVTKELFAGGIPAAAFATIKDIANVAHNITIAFLKKRIKKFSAEYERAKSNLSAGTGAIPDIHFERNYQVEGRKDMEGGLSIILEAETVEGLDYFYYSVRSIELGHSEAKVTKKSKYLDYSIEIQVTVLSGNTVETIISEPIQVLSVGFGENKFEKGQYPSDLIPIPKDSHILKVGLKIVETNPQEVSAQELLDFWKKLKEENGETLESILTSLLVEGDK